MKLAYAGRQLARRSFAASTCSISHSALGTTRTAGAPSLALPTHGSLRVFMHTRGYSSSSSSSSGKDEADMASNPILLSAPQATQVCASI